LPLVVTRLRWPGTVNVMLSWHRDAEIAAQAMRHLGIRAVRGSATRGWLGGLRGLLAARARGEDIVIVPDGPRGPRHEAKDGALQLARATGLPLVVVGGGAGQPSPRGAGALAGARGAARAARRPRARARLGRPRGLAARGIGGRAQRCAPAAAPPARALRGAAVRRFHAHTHRPRARAPEPGGAARAPPAPRRARHGAP